MFFVNNFGEYFDNWRKIQKELVAMEQISPKNYGEFLQKKKRRKKKKMGGK